MFHYSHVKARLVALLLPLMILCGCAATVYDPPQTVRVGFFAFDGYHMEHTSGDGDIERDGYGYDYLQRLAIYANWQYEYIGYDRTWSDMLRMLETGEIDLLTSAQKTPEREQSFAFSAQPIGYSATVVTVRTGDTRYTSTDYAAWSGIRVGMLRDNSRNQSFDDFAKEHGFAYTPVYFSDTEEMIAALKTGERIDAVVTSNLRSIQDEWIVATFDASPFYVMVRKEDQALLRTLDAAAEALSIQEPRLLDQLWDRYYQQHSGQQVAFTSQEREYLKAMGDTELTAIINPDRAPFSYYEEGQPKGILYELTREAIARTGLNVRLIEPEGRVAYTEMKDKGQVDLVLDLWGDPSEAENLGYATTETYQDVTISRVWNKDITGSPSTVAAVRGSDIARYIADRNGSEVTYYDTVQQAIEAVRTRKQDMTYLYTRVAERAIYQDETDQMMALVMDDTAEGFAIGVNKRQNLLLAAVLNKAVASISYAERSAIAQKYTAYEARPLTLLRYLRENPLALAGGLALCVVVVALLAGITVLQRRKAREHDRVVEERRRNELLSSALSMAEKADQAKGVFLSRVSHEMRTPLNAIIGFMELSKEPGQSPERVSLYHADCETAARQLLSIINDVLDMSAIEAGKMKIAEAPFDLKTLLSSLSHLFQTTCHAKGVAFKLHLLTPVEESLVGDSLRLNQILINLLGNAVKFTETGSVTLEVSQYEHDDNVFIRFAVADTGCGMDEEALGRLFKPFEQENAEIAQRYGGSGLGLSIVKNLVAMMQGAIDVKSAKGEGSRFTVDLPFKRAERPVPEQPEHSPWLLIVEKDESQRSYLTAMLQQMRLPCACAASAEEALAVLHPSGETVCIVEESLAEKTVPRLREARPELRFLLLCGGENEHAKAVAHALGIEHWLIKPVFQSTLYDQLMTVTGGDVKTAQTTPGIRQFCDKHVLLVEDNAMNQIVARELLRKCGVTSELAQNGKQAVEQFLQAEPERFDAILMDIQMPVMNGYEATAAIRASTHPRARTIPILALTANAFAEDVAHSLSAGMNGHIAKPIEMEALNAALAEAFRQEHRRDLTPESAE